jgi:hypothetical protein
MSKVNEPTASTNLFDTILYYIVFDLAVISLIFIVCIAIKLIFKMCRKKPSNFIQYHY